MQWRTILIFRPYPQRAAANVRSLFSKLGGNMGATGSVAFNFRHCGQIVFAPGTSEDQVMEAALEAGADDVITNDDGSLEVITGPYEFSAIKAALEKAGYKSEMGAVEVVTVSLFMRLRKGRTVWRWMRHLGRNGRWRRGGGRGRADRERGRPWRTKAGGGTRAEKQSVPILACPY